MEQMRIFFFFILMLSSAAEDIKSHFAQVQGGSVTFPDPVLENGFLSFEVTLIASVQGRKYNIWGKIYENRLFWNNKTGLFTLRGLQKNDSGTFKIDSKDRGDVITSHKLTVYEPVSAPEVTKLNMSTESCTLLCVVQKAEETTLLWFKEEEILNQSSSALSLLLPVEDFTSSYRCVAKNPAEYKTVDVNLRTLCGERNYPDTSPESHIRSYKIIVPIVTAVVVVVALLFVRWICLKQKANRETQGSELRDSDVVYTDIHIPDNGCRQERNQPGADEGPNLTTVYDKIQAHRIVPAETDTEAAPCLYSQITNSPRA